METHEANDMAKTGIEALYESLTEHENFHRRTIERVDGILLNAELFDLHPLVKKQLEEINGMKIKGERNGKSNGTNRKAHPLSRMLGHDGISHTGGCGLRDNMLRPGTM